ncbi:glycoside hydrolase family 65 protein [Agromyces sp. NPDC058110]|uniref:glycoside hydrolase family 65 protein n=1 Tax=Agromyces sp. NPDC058110 TaxID=3346345 RepID=UPI0036DCE1D9
MSHPLPFDVAPWSIGLTDLDEERLAHRESVFALANGHLGWRGCLDEGSPRGAAGSYLNGVFERHPMPYAEDGYGYPDDGQSVVNIPDGTVIRLFVDDEPFDVRRGTVLAHDQRLDFRTGTLTRLVDWVSPTGQRVRVRSERLVSLHHRALGAIRYEVEAVDDAAEVTLLSELVANEPLPRVHPDPRVMEVLERPLNCLGAFVAHERATLVHRTRRSRLGVAVSMDHRVAGPAATTVAVEASGDLARTTVRTTLADGERLRLDKFIGHEWSPSDPADVLRDRAEEAVAEAMHDGWDRVAAAQRERLDEYWQCADIEIEGAPRLLQAARLALFHVFQAAARAEVRSVPGKGLTGAGYEGHTFWDFEAYVLPLLTATAPEAAKQGLLWRHATLGHARARAAQLHLRGAAFAWRTIDGQESSGYWPASTAAFHVNADVAGAVVHYVRATGDDAFERGEGLELLVETARLWVSLGRWSDDGRFHLDGLTGPDEYSARVDDNLYTNLMAQLNLAAAADAARRHASQATALGVTDDEPAAWTAAAEAMAVPFDDELGVHEQHAGFTDAARWPFERMTADDYPLQEHHPYFDLYRKQVMKQADLVLALHFRHDAFTAEQKARAFAYAEALTVRDSSLSASAQAVIAAEVGHLDLAADHLAEAATIDLDDRQGDTSEGMHLAALAGVWTALVAGFGGLRDSPEGLRFAPRLPPAVGRLAFGVKVDGRTLRVDVRAAETTYLLSDGPAVTVHHFGEALELAAGTPTTRQTPPPLEPGPRPTHPEGREPRRFSEAFGD